MKPRSFLASLALVLAALAIGCGTEDPPEDDIASTQQALSTDLFEMPQNGYPPKGLDPNYALLSTIWQHPLNKAGVDATLGTVVVKGDGTSVLVSTLFNTALAGLPMSAEYLMDEIVSCALDWGHNVSGTTTMTWNGKFGLCDKGSPFDDWGISGASPACRQMVSACILARMNALDKHVPISIRVPEMFADRIPNSRPRDKVRVATYRRTNNVPPTQPASDWQPDFVGICTRNQLVTLQRTPAAMGQAVRVCTGIHACDNVTETIVLDSSGIYSGLLNTDDDGVTVSFTCPGDAATVPFGKPWQAYFSILVKPAIGGAPSVLPMLIPISNSAYPAPEQDVFTYVEGAYYGNILPENIKPGIINFDRNACYSDLWEEGKMYEIGRMCAAQGSLYECFIQSGPCDQDSWGRDMTGGQAFYGFEREPADLQSYGVTVFLNDPHDIVVDQVASEIVAAHDVCIPGARMVNDQTNGVVTSVCAADSYCCSAAWDSRCIGEVQSVAKSQECACSHAVCTTGAQLTNGCSPVVKKVCASDPYCCSTAWDSLCIQEVWTVANSQECAPP